MKRLFYTLLIIGSLSLSMMVTSCKESTVYYKYAHTPIAGWEKNDTLSFAIPPLTSPGLYQENLGLRITGAYPFMGITLIVEQEIFPNQESKKEKEERNKLQIMGVKSHQAKQARPTRYDRANPRHRTSRTHTFALSALNRKTA